jgi:dTMP kinase
MCADRAEHVQTVIRPALDAGLSVLCDRFEASTRAYQGAGLGLDMEQISTLLGVATMGLKPDAYLLFDIDPVTATTRRMAVSAEVNALDERTYEFKQRVREHYLLMAESEPNWHILDATAPIEMVTSQALALVQRVLNAS